MKTIKKTEEGVTQFQRVRDTTVQQWREVQRLVSDEGWQFCQKSEWKQATRTKEEV